MMGIMPGPSGPPPGPGGYMGQGGGYQPRFGYSMKPRMSGPPGLGGPSFGYANQAGASRFGAGPKPNLDSGDRDSEAVNEDGDGKRPRKSQMRRTVDYSSSFLRMLERRTWQRDFRDKRALQPDVLHHPSLLPPMDYLENPANAATTRFVKTATNKMRCPIFTLDWTPEGRRLITGASSGEFTLWNGLTFNFETILQAHDSPVRAMRWSHNGTWMITGDHGGYIKYWQSNMNNVKMFQAHKEAVRSVSFAPTDQKFASCSDDGTVRIWDFFTYNEERVLRGHGSDVKCVDWHPTKGLLASGSKDNQQPIKIWEPKSGAVLCTLHAHKSTVMDIKWNANGNWLLTASRDHLIKLFDIRNTKEEIQTFRGHKKEASTVAWHPVHENVFASGGSDGSIMFWNVGSEKEVGVVEQAHESIVWSLSWHPVGHILCSGSNDHTCKFWTRNKPGDTMRDKYNLNTLPSGQEDDISTSDHAPLYAPIIPGMAPEDRIDTGKMPPISGPPMSKRQSNIPGLDNPDDSGNAEDGQGKKKIPYSKPIPKSFQASWNDMSEYPPGPVDLPPPIQQQPPPFGGGPPQHQQFGGMHGGGPPAPMHQPHAPEMMEPPLGGVISLQELQRRATAVVALGNVYPVLAGSNLYRAVLAGEQAVQDVLRSEFLL